MGSNPVLARFSPSRDVNVELQSVLDVQSVLSVIYIESAVLHGPLLQLVTMGKRKVSALHDVTHSLVVDIVLWIVPLRFKDSCFPVL